MDFDVIVGSFVIIKNNTPKYVVPASNFVNAHLLGVPCLVLNDPHKGERKDILGNINVETVIDVKSCVRELLGKPYWSKDNSYITGLNGETGVDLYHKKCEIVSVPFMDIAGVDDIDKEYPFILVKYEGRYYRTLFREWSLYEP